MDARDEASATVIQFSHPLAPAAGQDESPDPDERTRELVFSEDVAA